MENKDGADAPDSHDNQTEKVSHATGGANDGQISCGSCKVDFAAIRRSQGETNCSFCDIWFCSQCTRFKKGDIVGNNAVLKRDDVFWACPTCLDKAKAAVKGVSGGERKYEGNDNQNDQPQKIENLDEKIENKIDQTIRNVLPDIVKQCIGHIQNEMTETVSASVSSAWTKTVMGDDSDFPSLNDPESRNAPVKPKVTLVTALKQVVSEHNEEDLRRQSRLANIIIHRVPERNEATGQERKEKDTETVKEILETIGVDTTPVQVFRLGRYQKTNEGESESSRPVKVQLDGPEIQQKVMNSARNLRNAPDHLRQISICYDMTEDERKKIKSMVAQAKEKSESSSKYIYKIRGPPWALEEVQYRKRRQIPDPPATQLQTNHQPEKEGTQPQPNATQEKR